MNKDIYFSNISKVKKIRVLMNNFFSYPRRNPHSQGNSRMKWATTAMIVASKTVGKIANLMMRAFSFIKTLRSNPSPALVRITASAICLCKRIKAYEFYS